MSNPPLTDADPLLTLSQRKGLTWRTFAVPAARLMYVQINKNACTSVKWMIAGIAGEDVTAFTPSLEASTNDQDDIHDRRQWVKTPKLDELDPKVRQSIHPDNGWFVFAITRDPRVRLFSAWESKLLLDNPGYTEFRDRPWYPRHPVTSESVVEDFEKFVELFERRPDIGIRRDGHFRDQVEMLHEDLVTYSKIYDIRELGLLQDDLRKHLDGVGWHGELTLPRFNDTPLRANAAPFANGVRERVEKIYAADFERFGDRWDFGIVESTREWTDVELKEVDWRADSGRRIGYLRDESTQLRAKVAAERRRANKQKARADALARELATVSASAGSPPAAASSVDRLRADARRVVGAVRRRVRRRLARSAR